MLGQLGGEVSNLDLGLQRTPCCRYTTPEVLPTLTGAAAGPDPECDGPPGSGYGSARHGLTDQEAPQAHAQEEAQEASQEDSLAASPAGSLEGPVCAEAFLRG